MVLRYILIPIKVAKSLTLVNGLSLVKRLLLENGGLTPPNQALIVLIISLLKLRTIMHSIKLTTWRPF